MKFDSPSGGLPPPARCGRRSGGVRLRSAACLLRWAARLLPGAEGEVAGLHTVVPPGAVCVDVGTARMMCVVTLSALAGPQGRVHLFEPLGRRARWSAAVAALLGGTNVVVHRVAVGRRDRGRAPHTGGHRPQTLDGVGRRLGLERVDFIKVDAGNDGYGVLTGAFHTLLRDRPVLLIQTEMRHRPGHCSDPGSLVGNLTVTLGYRMYRWGAGGWQHTADITDDCRTYLFRAGPPRPP
ncbi:hypothetical protein ACF05L_20125 [Streptomyces bobili]|uniref:hypothetical protein n=1 Tax=Streptomyces bobili TaxID=67280 RepID=UPI0036FF1BCC